MACYESWFNGYILEFGGGSVYVLHDWIVFKLKFGHGG